MYLKEIVASGFKSFADKINIKLENKITCIVGPNGSGKSNVVDAVRWVLGEQSVKSLRGEGSMSEVIFSGSKSRNPLNVAWVELIFDNTDHYLNIPYTEISIKRRVYRSGENEYFLNNEKCRLKDITNLLLDSGVGKESFNIISQGEVERILSSSPLERRLIFEEAAGILKYKKRKEEALHKLDRTHNNLDRVNDIISELEIQLTPLKEQSEKAKEYLENKEGLDKYEVALLAYDIERLSNEVEKAKERKEQLEKEIMVVTNEFSTSDAKAIEDNNNLEKYEQELVAINTQLVSVASLVERINGEKNLLKERANTSSTDITQKIRDLLDKKGNIEKSKKLIDTSLETERKNLDTINKDIDNSKNRLDTLKKEKLMEHNEYSRLDKNLINLNHRIDSLMLEIDQGGNLPSSVKNILNNSELIGIHNTLGNIINIEDNYIKALEVAIASSKNFIITENEDAAKDAINYLKDNHLGRATFFPLTVIKPRYVDNEALAKVKNSTDFIAVLSELVDYDNKYKNIISNQLGTTLVATDINAAIRLSKLISHRYKIVTLAGDVIHVGGSMSGGSSYQSKSIVSLKQELITTQSNKKETEINLQAITNKITQIDTEMSRLNETYLQLANQQVIIKDLINSKQQELDNLDKELEDLNREISSFKGLEANNLSEMEESLINQYHEQNALKEELLLRQKNLSNKIEDLKEKIEMRMVDDKQKNFNLKKLEKESRQLEIDITRNDVKLDNMLTTLNEDYSLTYERARKEYFLDIEVEEARLKVNTYRSNIKRIGMVNLAAIDEFERVNTRYDFLTKQKEDLLTAEDTLLEIMNEMDEVMIEEFETTFEKVRCEFKQVFRELFNGGNADLKLTNPDDLLTTGIEIVASPPGKKLTTINLLSGGEKTFTAISLLFSILNVKTVPFCLFDEVEAALDEANVESFGKYLYNYKDKTQFLIITHKKKTMEFADVLYGITMQESGVSKLVSVKLNDKESTNG